MKKFIRLLAVSLAVMTLAGCSLVTVNNEKVVVAKVGGETITKAAFDTEFNAFLAQYNYTQESTEIADQLADLKAQYIDQMVQEIVLKQKISELGLDNTTDAEKAAAEDEIQQWYDGQYAALVEEYEADETVEDPQAEATATLVNYLKYYSTTLEGMKAEEVEAIPFSKLYDDATKDIDVAEGEVKTEFDARVAAAKTSYDADLSAFIDDFENGADIFYTPDGCFYVKHILISVTDEQKTEIQNLRADDDETIAATADVKRDEYLLTIKEKAQTVLDLVNDGGDFVALMDEYGEDPGMKSDLYKDGYLTFSGDPGFVAEFTEACKALTADEMTSGLVPTDYGYHIIRRVATVTGSDTAYDDIKDALKAEMLDTKQSAAYEVKVEEWVAATDIDIKTNKL